MGRDPSDARSPEVNSNSASAGGLAFIYFFVYNVVYTVITCHLETIIKPAQKEMRVPSATEL